MRIFTAHRLQRKPYRAYLLSELGAKVRVHAIVAPLVADLRGNRDVAQDVERGGTTVSEVCCYWCPWIVVIDSLNECRYRSQGRANRDHYECHVNTTGPELTTVAFTLVVTNNVYLNRTVSISACERHELLLIVLLARHRSWGPCVRCSIPLWVSRQAIIGLLGIQYKSLLRWSDSPLIHGMPLRFVETGPKYR